MDYDYDYGYGSGAAGAIFAIYVGIFIFSLVVAAVIYVLNALVFSRLFKKVGIEGWIAWVPFYNTWKWLELGGQHGWLVLISLIPYGSIVTLVFVLIGSYRIGTAFGKGGEWTVLAYFLSPLWAYLLSRPQEAYHPEAFAQHGWPPPFAGYGSVPAAARQPGAYQPGQQAQPYPGQPTQAQPYQAQQPYPTQPPADPTQPPTAPPAV